MAKGYGYHLVRLNALTYKNNSGNIIATIMRVTAIQMDH
jgi:hypothetical protein